MKPVAEMGRPLECTEEVTAEICERLASGESLNAICRSSDHLPNKTTVMRWLLSDNPKLDNFCNRYAQARAIQYEFLADDIMDIADDGRNDFIKREDPDNEGYVTNGEVVARSRLRVDTRKWFMSKVLPKFMDKPQEETPKDQSITINLIDAKKPDAD